MFTRTPWRIDTWNTETVSASLGIGLGGGVAEIGLVNRATGEHRTLHCAGVNGSIGLGVDLAGVNPGSGALGFQPNIRTQAGTLYKNDIVVPGELTFQLLHDSNILVQGIELLILDEGQAGYMVVFASTGSTVASLLGGGGLLTEGLAIGTCRAMTFLSCGQAGLPNVGLAGYRYTVTN